MAADKNVQQQFTELEYVFQKYYNENFAPIVNKEYNDLRNKQAEEYRRYLDNRPVAPGASGMMMASMAAQEVKYVGEWNSKDTDWLLKHCNSRFFADAKVKDDFSKMVLACRATIVSKVGVEKYKEMSAGTPNGDLASFYVSNRFTTLFTEQLARKEMPKSTLEYILSKGFKDSLAGFIAGTPVKTFALDDEVRAMSEKLYNPSGGAKAAAFGVSFLCDTAMTGGYGSVGKAATWLAVDGGVRLASSYIPSEKSFDQMFGEAVFNDENAVSSMRQNAKKVNPGHSEVVDLMNQNFSKKMKVPAYHPPFSPTRVAQMSKQLREATADGQQHLDNVKKLCKEFGMTFGSKKDYPAWMKEKSKEECIRYSSQFFAIAAEMKSAGKREMTLNGKKYTYEDCCQRSYDYARAAAAKQEEENAALRREREAEEARQREQQATQSRTAAAAVAAPVQPQMTTTQQGQYSMQQAQQAQQIQQNNSQAMRTAAVDSWGGLMDKLGLSGFGDIGHNLGYVLAMLPDMLIGMFTGQSKSLKLRDNMFPLAAIFAGLFVKNPILKMLLVGLGGANLLNKAGHEAMENAGVSQRPVRYREYSNELLDPRIEGPAMKGNSLVATIDGVPSSIIIDDVTADAYYKGKIPLNTLCNAVLRKYDEQYAAVSSNYDQRLDETEDRTLSRGIK